MSGLKLEKRGRAQIENSILLALQDHQAAVDLWRASRNLSTSLSGTSGTLTVGVMGLSTGVGPVTGSALSGTGENAVCTGGDSGVVELNRPPVV